MAVERGCIDHFDLQRFGRLAMAFLAAGLGTWALIQIVRDRRRRGVVLAVLGIVAPWLGRAILNGALGAG